MFATIKSLIPEPRQADQPRHYVGRHRQPETVTARAVVPAPAAPSEPMTPEPAEATSAPETPAASSAPEPPAASLVPAASSAPDNVTLGAPATFGASAPDQDKA